MAVVIRTDGIRESLYNLQLEDLQKAVGGLIDIVRLNKDEILVINDEGKLMGLPENRVATQKGHENSALWADDWIAGDAVWISRKDHPEQFEDDDLDYQDWDDDWAGPWDDPDYGYADEQGDH